MKSSSPFLRKFATAEAPVHGVGLKRTLGPST